MILSDMADLTCNLYVWHAASPASGIDYRVSSVLQNHWISHINNKMPDLLPNYKVFFYWFYQNIFYFWEIMEIPTRSMVFFADWHNLAETL